eukprot:CAMPEP_0203988084 /NCGR_PEP_ID=MMETSP0360-20130528/7187_1 /ASSEMBLY_ACC=CAM_ASM_000342 /TAXON_ID=268821 /ORGANISM="Scrippsiella Hangoei, Strain SHTV-5" /LENGTH=116 /DNA_ID=CAMNT_0050927785 /DNA_START=307 /DNA_END=657 /DNA_ORIENTATION=-
MRQLRIGACTSTHHMSFEVFDSSSSFLSTLILMSKSKAVAPPVARCCVRGPPTPRWQPRRCAEPTAAAEATAAATAETSARELNWEGPSSLNGGRGRADKRMERELGALGAEKCEI